MLTLIMRLPPIVQNCPYAFCEATLSPFARVLIRVGYWCGGTSDDFAGHFTSFRAARGRVRGSVGYERHLTKGTRNLSMGFLNITHHVFSRDKNPTAREQNAPFAQKGVYLYVLV